MPQKTIEKEQAKNSVKKSLPSAIHQTHLKADSTANHYGFVPFAGLEVEKQDIAKSKTFKDPKIKEMSGSKQDLLNFDGFLEEKIAIVRTYLDKKMADLSQPPMISYSGPLPGNPHVKKNSREHIFNLDIIGNHKSIADAIIIETSFVILKEHYEDMELSIEINCIGDKDSLARFTREFIAYYKKHLNEMPAPCRAIFKKNPFDVLGCTHDECLALQDEAPKAMSYLTEPSRIHFKELLEYIESLSLPYIINHALVGSQNYCSGVIFRIVGISKKEKTCKPIVLGLGERYNTVARKAWGKKEIPAIGAALAVKDDSGAKIAKKKVEAPRFYFIQLGYDAKLKSLAIIEMLRQAKIPVVQALSRDKITTQLAAAEKLNVPYILILGQKEAIEESVTVRTMSNRSQETVPISELVAYLKKLA
ncbi:MAG: hypothetical protein RL094_614 [Candidatus Parcubacteria bacterium]|jgi:histidyl-tRNA synthetase